MDSKLVSGSLSATEDSEHHSSLSSFTYTDKFNELFPYYLSIGMTYEQYWEKDPALAKYYREADELRREQRNYELWLQGMYIYEAIGDCSPILRAFAKKNTKPIPYPSSPYPIGEKQQKREQEAKERKVAEKGKKFMEALMASTNNKFKEKTQNDT